MNKFVLIFSFAVIFIAAIAAGCTGPDTLEKSTEMTATGVIKVGAMNFNEVSLDDVTGLNSASKFSVDGVDTFKDIGSAEHVTFMESGSATLQIMSGDGNLLATGILSIPEDYGEHSFTISLEGV